MSKAKFVISQEKVIAQYNAVKEHADFVSYSSKTNQHITPILEKNTDSWFSVHFVNELKHIRDTSRVIFLAQAWTEEHIQSLIDRGIRWFIVDNEEDLTTLLTYLNNNDVNIHLSLRMQLKELSIKTERYYVFGMTKDVVNKKIKEITNSNLKEKISKLGVHFHRKTQNMSEWSLKYQLEQLLDTETLEYIDHVNIGGGLPSQYANTNENILPTIWEKIDELKTWLNKNNIQLIIEPGRFIAAPTTELQTTIIGIHNNTIIVNASVYNSDMDALIVPVKLLIKEETTEGKDYLVKGITPCSLDLFRYKVRLNNPKIGDTLTFLNAGAYNFSTDFCDLEVLPTEVIR